ncbi:MAG: CDP-glucose 4,6-dehydratase [Myxococcota bacterium]
MSDAELVAAWKGKRVLVTGHTGFKGAWLTLWLERLGAQVTGFALAPESDSLFLAAQVGRSCVHVEGDVRDVGAVSAVLKECRPDAVLHLAAQSLVRRGYAEPLLTLETNVMGTANVLDAVRTGGHRCAVVIVSSDKCYENLETGRAYRESDPMGGHDPYSMSKGATELVTSAWRRSFFPTTKLAEHGVAVASARAGNVIGGGDWAVDRIVPDCIRALKEGRTIAVRNPTSVRPWQHVLEPLSGYLMLGARLMGADAAAYCEGWNFGPSPDSSRPVGALASGVVAAWGTGRWEDRSDPHAPHEAAHLALNIEQAQARLKWAPRWGFEETILRTVAWYREQARGASPEALRALTLSQIADYEAAG